MAEKVKKLIIKQLVNFNVNKIYGYPGDTILSFMSALKDSPIKLYTTRHESTAGLMASAESKLTDNISVCLAHSGPGTANIINGIADSYSDKTPLLLISGQVEGYNIGTNYKQFVNQLELTNPLTVYSTILLNPESTIDILYKALTKAISTGGVSHLVIPMDIWDKESSAVPRQFPAHLKIKPMPAESLLDQAAERINNCHKPVILYGRGAKNSITELIAFADKIKAPLVNTLPAAGLIDFGHPLALGGLGHSGNNYSSQILGEADLIIILAATWWPIDYTPRAPQIIQFDVTKNNIAADHPVDLGIYSDLQSALSTILNKVNTKDDSQWQSHFNEIKNKWLDEINTVSGKSDWPLNPAAVITIISEMTQENEIISLDSGDNVIYFGKYFGNKCKDILISGSWRTMGFALPASLTAKINFNQSPVTCITGDGGLNMVLGEILTAARYQLPVKIIVLNNGSLAMEKNRMITEDLKVEEVSLTNPDYVKLAEACGISGVTVENIENLKNVLSENVNPDKPLLIDIPVSDSIIPGTKL